MKRDLYIYSPYSDGELGLTLDSFFKKKFVSQKKLYLIQNLVNDNTLRQKINTSFFIKRKNYLLYIFQVIKLYFWAYLNNLKLRNIKVTSNIKKLSKNSFFYANTRTVLKNNPALFLKETNCIKIFNLSHFEVETGLIAKNAKEIGVDYFVFENNLSKNSDYFKHFFPFYKKDTIVLPHVYSQRFKNYINFDDRKNLCFASGRVILFDPELDSNYTDFVNFFNVNYQHKLRFDIYQNRTKINGLINSYISLKDTSKKLDNQESARIKENYYKFNIVDMYNKHKMFVAPEGLNDTPPIGFVEGMSCGSALFAINNEMYTDLGLVNDVHYVSYDGSLEDLISKIKYYQKNNAKLKIIATNGHNFVIDHFNPKRVSQSFVNFLNSIEIR